MPEKFLTVATFDTPFQASLAKNRLEAEGIAAYLLGESTVGWFWYLSNAVGGIKLQVAEADLERAGEILAAARDGPAKTSPPRAAATKTATTCARCGTRKTPRARFCSSCGLLVEDVDGLFAAAKSGDVEAADERGHGSLAAQGEDLALRACKAAVFGLLVLPPVGHLYSLGLLLRLALFPADLSRTAMRHVYVALAIDSLVFVAAALMIRTL